MKFENIVILGNKPCYSQDDLCVVVIFPFEIHISRANPYFRSNLSPIGPGGLIGASCPTYEWSVCFSLRTKTSTTGSIVAGNEVPSIEQAIQESESWTCQALSLIGDSIDKAREWRNVIEVHNS